jgi:hypothetical protein
VMALEEPLSTATTFRSHIHHINLWRQRHTRRRARCHNSKHQLVLVESKLNE